LKPTPHGKLITVRGRIVEVGKKKVVVRNDLTVEGEVCVRGEVIAVVAPPTMTGSHS
jgi:acyl-CoA thioesterase FadM